MTDPQGQTSNIWHIDIFDIVCACLDTASIKSVRLVNHKLSETATPHLFNKLALGLRKRSLECLAWVTAQPKFAKGVREVVWETAHYYHEDHPYDENIFEEPSLFANLGYSDDAKIRKQQQQNVLTRLCTLAAEVLDLLERLRNDTDKTLAACFSKLPALKTVVLVPTNGDFGQTCPISRESVDHSLVMRFWCCTDRVEQCRRSPSSDT